MIKIILWFVFCFFSTYSFACVYGNFNNVKLKLNLKLIFLISVGAVLQTIIQCNNYTFLSVLSFFIYFPILFYSINKVSIKKLFFYLMLIWLSGVVLDIVFAILLSIMFKWCGVNYNNYPVLMSLVLSAFVSIILLILSKSTLLNDRIRGIYVKINDVRYVDILLIILALFIICIDVIMVININNLSVHLLLLIVTILMITSFIILFKYLLDAREIGEYLNTLRENNKFYVRVNDDNRIFKHNLTAKLSSVKSVGSKKVNALIDDLILQFNKSIDFADSMKVIPYGLNGIIYQKLYPYLDDLNVKINNDIKYDIFTVLRPRRYNVFVEKIMLALDNAIEACLNSEEKALVINIFDDEANICVEIENTFASDINLDLLGTKNYSTKGKKRGLGLFSMFRNNEAKISVKIINNLFVNKITTKKRLND